MKTDRWIRLTQCINIPLHEGRAVQVDGHEVAVFNLGNRFLAVENRCPHRGGPLADGIVSEQKVVCPLHARKVCLETGHVDGTSEKPLCAQTYATRIVDGCVDLRLSMPVMEEIAQLPANFSLDAVELGLT